MIRHLLKLVWNRKRSNALIAVEIFISFLVVFGVVTEYCVRLAAKGLLERGKKVSIVQDAIETLATDASTRTCAELTSMKAHFINTSQALALLS